jgi:hypothetical protein
MNTTQIMIPMRTAEQQFVAAAANSILLRILKANGLHEVDGVGGKCLMEPAEYEAYEELCAKWAEAGSDQHDAPEPAVMLMATEEEVAELEAEQRRPRSYFRSAFREVEHLVLSCHQSISEDERDDIILTLLSKLMPLREAVLRAEEIWEDTSFANALATYKGRERA